MRPSRSTCSAPYQAIAALAAGRGEQLALLVEADRVDRDVTAAGELLDADASSTAMRAHSRAGDPQLLVSAPPAEGLVP